MPVLRVNCDYLRGLFGELNETIYVKCLANDEVTFYQALTIIIRFNCHPYIAQGSGRSLFSPISILVPNT